MALTNVTNVLLYLTADMSKAQVELDKNFKSLDRHIDNTEKKYQKLLQKHDQIVDASDRVRSTIQDLAKTKLDSLQDQFNKINTDLSNTRVKLVEAGNAVKEYGKALKDDSGFKQRINGAKELINEQRLLNDLHTEARVKLELAKQGTYDLTSAEQSLRMSLIKQTEAQEANKAKLQELRQQREGLVSVDIEEIKKYKELESAVNKLKSERVKEMDLIKQNLRAKTQEIELIKKHFEEKTSAQRKLKLEDMRILGEENKLLKSKASTLLNAGKEVPEELKIAIDKKTNAIKKKKEELEQLDRMEREHQNKMLKQSKQNKEQTIKAVKSYNEKMTQAEKKLYDFAETASGKAAKAIVDMDKKIVLAESNIYKAARGIDHLTNEINKIPEKKVSNLEKELSKLNTRINDNKQALEKATLKIREYAQSDLSKKSKEYIKAQEEVKKLTENLQKLNNKKKEVESAKQLHFTKEVEKTNAELKELDSQLGMTGKHVQDLNARKIDLQVAGDTNARINKLVAIIFTVAETAKMVASRLEQMFEQVVKKSFEAFREVDSNILKMRSLESVSGEAKDILSGKASQKTPYARLSEDLLSLADAYGQSADKSTSAINKIIEAGFEGAKGIDVYKKSLTVAIATQASQEKIVSASIKMLQNYKFNLEDLPKYLNMMAVTAARSSLANEDFADKMGYISTAAARLKITLPETMVVFGSAAKRLKDASEASTAFVNMVTKISDPSEEAKETIEKLNKALGLTGNQAIVFSQKGIANIKDELGNSVPEGQKFLKWLEKLKGAIEKLEDPTQATNAIFNEIRASKGFQAIVQDVENLGDELEVVTTNTDFINQAFDEMTKSISFKVESATNQMHNNFMRFFSQNRSTLTDWLNYFISIINRAGNTFFNIINQIIKQEGIWAQNFALVSASIKTNVESLKNVFSVFGEDTGYQLNTVLWFLDKFNLGLWAIASTIKVIGASFKDFANTASERVQAILSLDVKRFANSFSLSTPETTKALKEVAGSMEKLAIEQDKILNPDTSKSDQFSKINQEISITTAKLKRAKEIKDGLIGAPTKERTTAFEKASKDVTKLEEQLKRLGKVRDRLGGTPGAKWSEIGKIKPDDFKILPYTPAAPEDRSGGIVLPGDGDKNKPNSGKGGNNLKDQWMKEIRFSEEMYQKELKTQENHYKHLLINEEQYTKNKAAIEKRRQSRSKDLAEGISIRGKSAGEAIYKSVAAAEYENVEDLKGKIESSLELITSYWATYNENVLRNLRSRLKEQHDLETTGLEQSIRLMNVKESDAVKMRIELNSKQAKDLIALEKKIQDNEYKTKDIVNQIGEDIGVNKSKLRDIEVNEQVRKNSTIINLEKQSLQRSLESEFTTVNKKKEILQQLLSYVDKYSDEYFSIFQQVNDKIIEDENRKNQRILENQKQFLGLLQQGFSDLIGAGGGDSSGVSELSSPFFSMFERDAEFTGKINNVKNKINDLGEAKKKAVDPQEVLALDNEMNRLGKTVTELEGALTQLQSEDPFSIMLSTGKLFFQEVSKGIKNITDNVKEYGIRSANDIYATTTNILKLVSGGWLLKLFGLDKDLPLEEQLIRPVKEALKEFEKAFADTVETNIKKLRELRDKQDDLFVTITEQTKDITEFKEQQKEKELKAIDEVFGERERQHKENIKRITIERDKELEAIRAVNDLRNQRFEDQDKKRKANEEFIKRSQELELGEDFYRKTEGEFNAWYEAEKGRIETAYKTLGTLSFDEMRDQTMSLSVQASKWLSRRLTGVSDEPELAKILEQETALNERKTTLERLLSISTKQGDNKTSDSLRTDIEALSTSLLDLKNQKEGVKNLELRITLQKQLSGLQSEFLDNYYDVEMERAKEEDKRHEKNAEVLDQHLNKEKDNLKDIETDKQRFIDRINQDYSKSGDYFLSTMRNRMDGFVVYAKNKFGGDLQTAINGISFQKHRDYFSNMYSEVENIIKAIASIEKSKDFIVPELKNDYQKKVSDLEKSSREYSQTTTDINPMWNTPSNVYKDPFSTSTPDPLNSSIKKTFQDTARMTLMALPFGSSFSQEQIDSLAKKLAQAQGVTYYANGGVIDRPTLAMMGERGAETVFNAQQMRNLHNMVKSGGSVSNSQVLNVSFPNATINANNKTDVKKFAEEVTKVIAQKVMRSI
jgi:TP901 family phage tail tape measure protein